MVNKGTIINRVWEELKRRKVIQVITVYAAIAFVILQLVDIVAAPLRLPDWTEAFVIVLLAVGFIIAVFLSWVYDITPAGVKKTAPLSRSRTRGSVSVGNARGWKVATYLSAVIITGLMAFNYLNKNDNWDDISKVEKSIAVLPFVNNSPNDTNTYFINSLMEEILNHLQMVSGLRVISRTSVEQYRNTPKPIPEISKEQDVNYIVEGSGQKYGNSFKVNVQLFSGRKEKLLWGNTYEKKISIPADIISIQSSIAETIVTELKGTLTPEEKRQIEKIHTSNLTAYDFYQKGKEEFMKFWIDVDDRIALERAEMLYKKASEFDPGFAEAYIGLAEVFWSKHYWSSYFNGTPLDSALILADKALLIDDQIAEAYLVKGWYFDDRGMTDEALEEYDKALILNPNDWKTFWGKACLYDFDDPSKFIENLSKAASLTHGSEELPTLLRNIGGELLITGFIDKAREYFTKAFTLDGDSAFYMSCLGGIEHNQGNYNAALKYYEKAHLLRKNYSDPVYNLGTFSILNGQYKEALGYYQKIISDYGDVWMDWMRMGFALWHNGNKKEADYYLSKQVEYCNAALKSDRPYRKVYQWYYNLAAVYAFRGDKGNAYRNLRLLNQDKNCFLWQVTLIKNDPMFNNIRNEKEFGQIVNDMEAKYQVVHNKVAKWLEHEKNI